MKHPLELQTWQLRIAGLTVLYAAVFGCGQRSPEKYRVTGSVTWNGEPLADGDILLKPTDGTIVPDAGRIQNGQFELLARPGPMRVEIFASRVTVPAVPGKLGETREQFLPPRYNTHSQLKTEVQPIAENRVAFELVGE